MRNSSLSLLGAAGGLRPPLSPAADQEDDSQSSSSNSPTRADYEESDFYGQNNDSQSSIGVSTFQDMAVTEGRCLPAIERLPAEVLICIFSKLQLPPDLLNCMLVCKRWARNSVDLLWLRPACTTWPRHSSICRTLSLPNPYFAYREFVKRLNLAALSDDVSDGSVEPLSVCQRVERLTLTNCEGITDQGLISLISGNPHLLALDITGAKQIGEPAINALADHCKRLQGLNTTNCSKITNESLIKLARNCRYIKRLKLNNCAQVEDAAIMEFAMYCPNLLEIDLHECISIGNEPVTALLTYGQSLRELRLAHCELISDSAFLSLPPRRVYEHLRILDLTSCARLTDLAVEKIIDAAPRLRNLVLAKCRNITDVAVHAISKLGKNLHYVHLGHCHAITDEAVTALVTSCNRIRYIDLGCCANLTDTSVMKLATLPKLRRIGLVKCHRITDDSVYALAQSRHDNIPSVRPTAYRMPGNHASLERVHLSYCTNLTLRSILILLNSCPRLTHLSLTGVSAFLRRDLEQFCREAPPEFTPHQRGVFCVFSGDGVRGLRRYLNQEARQRAMENKGSDSGAEEDDDDQTMRGTVGDPGLNGEDGDTGEDEDDDLNLSEVIQPAPDQHAGPTTHA